MTTQTRRTLGQLRTAVRRRMGLSDNDTSVTYEVIDEAINAALRQVSVEHNWPWLLKSATVSTVSGTETVAVAVDWIATKTVFNSNPLGVLRNSHLDDLLAIPTTTTGPPAYYVIDQELIRLRPVPDGVYSLTHYYFRTEPLLTGDSSTPLIPQGYDEGVVEYAAYLVYRFKHDENRAAASLASYEKWLARTSGNLSESTSPRPPKVRPGSLI